MKALVLTGARRLELQERPVPQPGPGQALIRHLVTAISTGSEVIRYLRGAGPDIGYLGAGVVEAVGPGVTGLQPGDRVRDSGPHHEYVLQSAEHVIKLPDGLDFEQAAYAYIPTLGLHALRLCDYRLGENACVIGQGVVGVMGSALAEALGIQVVGLDTDESRLAVAAEMGVSYPLNPLASDFTSRMAAVVGDKGIDVTVDATGSYHGLLLALDLTRRWGRIAILGMYRPDPPDPIIASRLHDAYLRNLHAKELRLVGCSNDPVEDYPSHISRFSIHDNIRLSLDLLTRGRYSLRPAITDRLAPADGLDLYERLARREGGSLSIVYHWSEKREANDRVAHHRPRPHGQHH
ncbi:MAG: zinc-binding dehydrogenase [Anaerolineae bacterium]|nr:zinc-binding dehydrogenase [Anaerolineae bacterium]